MDTTHVICALLEVSACRAELHVNGWPVARRGPTGVINASRPVQHFLVPGLNELELLVEPGATPSQARDGRRQLDRQGASASAQLMRFRDGVMATRDNGEVLCEVVWKSADGAAPAPGAPEMLEDPSTFPKSLGAICDLGATAPRWPWQDAPVPELVAEARAVLEALTQALHGGSVDAFHDLVAASSADWLRAYPVWTDAMMRQDHERFVSFYARSGEPTFPLAPDRHDFRLVAGGRVLECVDDDFTPSIRLRAPTTGEAVPYELFLARIDGSLRVVR
jgi:hypothetical protein